MKRCLFVLSIYNYARELDPAVECLACDGFEPHVLLGWTGETADEYARSAELRGWTVHRVPPKLAYVRTERDPRTDDEPPVQPPTSLPRHVRLKSSIGITLYKVRLFVSQVREFASARRFGSNLIQRIAPTVVFGSSYRSCGTFDQAIALATRRRQIPYCCIPQGPYVGTRNAIDARFSHLEHGMLEGEPLRANSSVARRLLARVAPNWVGERDGRRIFSWEPSRMLAARITGLLDPEPWQQPSVRYDVCFVESKFAHDLLLASGYPPDRIVVSGKPLLDEVLKRVGDNAQEQLVYDELGLDPEAPFVLLNVEPAYEHAYASREEHWRQFEAVLESATRACPNGVVLSLHPLCDRIQYHYAEERFGVKIAERKIVELYPYCDVSVSFPCSTNLLAEVFGKPLVIYDFYGLTREGSPRADLFRVPGATFAYDADSLPQQIHAALSTRVTSPRAEPMPISCDVIRHELTARFGL